jgi:uncharacterized protein (TIGR00255 family)
MKSMTGFGVGEAQTPAGRLIVELRTVNHRFLDVRVRAPRELSDLVSFVENLARERLSRGRVEVAVRVEGGAAAISLDVERARSAFLALAKLRDELSPESEVPLSILAAVPDLFAPATERERESMRVACRAAFEQSLGALGTMRADEGRAHAQDLGARHSAVRKAADAISARAPFVLELYHKRLRQRVGRLLGPETHVDAGRLEQEVALLADRSDVTEELTRLSSHCSQFDVLLSGGEAVGRRLDFLLQEMVREANTIGSKAQDADVAHLVVELKSELERMREQVQNVE